MFELLCSRWMMFCIEGYEILVFIYISDCRGKVVDLKVFCGVYSIILDCFRDFLKIYSVF